MENIFSSTSQVPPLVVTFSLPPLEVTEKGQFVKLQNDLSHYAVVHEKLSNGDFLEVEVDLQCLNKFF